MPRSSSQIKKQSGGETLHFVQKSKVNTCMNFNLDTDYTFTWDANEKEGIILIVHDPDRNLEAVYGNASPDILQFAVETKYKVRVPKITLH